MAKEFDLLPSGIINYFTYAPDMGIYVVYASPSPASLIAGNEYHVEWDGVHYTCQAVEIPFGGTTFVGIGNSTVAGGTVGGDLPFGICTSASTNEAYIFSLEEGESHTVRVYQGELEVEATKIVIKNAIGEEVEYETDKVFFKTTSGDKQIFTKGTVIDGVKVELDLSKGNQVISAPTDNSYKEVTVVKPYTLIPENIVKDVNIGGVVGTFEAESDSDGDTEVTVSPTEYSEDRKIINFYDYDGTLLKYYILKPDELLRSLPTPPHHEGLVFAGWNHSLASINSHKMGIDVGAMYRTDDGSTKLFMDIPYEGFIVTLNFSQSVANGVTVDWGDGVTSTTNSTVGYTEIAHTYASVGKHIIRMIVHDGCDVILGNDKKVSGYGCNLFRDSVGNTGGYYLLKVNIGEGISLIEGDCFAYMDGALQTITIPPNVELENNEDSFYNSSIKFIVYPIGCTYVENEYSYQLQGVSISETVKTAKIGFNYGRLWNHLIIPNNVTSCYIQVSDRNYSGTVAYLILGTGLETLGGSIAYAKKVWSFSEKVDLIKLLHSSSSYTNIVEEFHTAEGSVTELANNLGEYAHGLKKCVLPKSVKSIGNGVFYHAYNLEYPIPDDNNIEVIGGSSFSYSGIKRLVLPRIKSMGYLSNCYNLERLKFSNKLTSLGYIASCYNLKEIVIPHSITTLSSSSTGNSNSRIPNVVLLGDDLTLNSSSFSGTSTSKRVLQTLDVFCKTKITSVNSSAFNYAYVQNLIIRKKDSVLEKVLLLLDYSGAKNVYVTESLYDNYANIYSGGTVKKIEENYDICGQEAVITYDSEKEQFMDLSKNYYTPMSDIDYERTEESIDTGACYSYPALDKTKFIRIEKVEVK